MRQNLIDIRQLKKYYPVKGGVFKRHIADVKAVDGVDLKIEKGECLGLVGESGCGKTTLGKTLLRLHDSTAGRIYFDQPAEKIEEVESLLNSERADGRRHGTTELKSMDITKLKGRALLDLREKVQIVFQDPSESLSPRMLVKNIVAEPLVAQHLVKPREVEGRVLELLDKVGLGKAHLMRYPHEFSGGQRQRIGIARALILRPKFIVCDEPVSALDVSVQSQVLNILMDLQDEHGLTYLFIAHNLSVVEHIADRVAVMYVGKIVELADREELYQHPQHPYTQALMSAIPVPDPKAKRERIILKGDVPSPVNPPAGCRFHTRCPFAMDRCSREEPVFKDYGGEHYVACWLLE
jgi:oligopeptide/dipeptide ABC transporter ATP-binding protein